MPPWPDWRITWTRRWNQISLFALLLGPWLKVPMTLPMIGLTLKSRWVGTFSARVLRKSPHITITSLLQFPPISPICYRDHGTIAKKQMFEICSCVWESMGCLVTWLPSARKLLHIWPWYVCWLSNVILYFGVSEFIFRLLCSMCSWRRFRQSLLGEKKIQNNCIEF